MAIRDLIPWKWGSKNVPVRRVEDPFYALQRDINRLFDEFFRDFGLPALRGENGDFGVYMPEVDVAESDDEIRIEVELPGMDEKDIDVTVSAGAVTIRGEKTREKEDRHKDYVYRERSFGTFERTIPLPEGIDLDKVKATFKSGVLTLVLPRTEEARRSSRRIEIEAA